MPFGDFNNDGHVDGRDYALFKIATGDNDSGGSSGGSGGGGGCRVPDDDRGDFNRVWDSQAVWRMMFWANKLNEAGSAT